MHEPDLESPGRLSVGDLPAVPLTLEGAGVLHQMMRVRRAEWKALSQERRDHIAAQAAATLGPMEQAAEGQTAVYSVLGHKADLLFLHFRRSFDRLSATESERGIRPHSPEWDREVEEVLGYERKAMAPRRGESRNWYQAPLNERQRMTHEHSLVGRRYAGEVKQIISGSIGLDDWEWGVDLFADDPVAFKKLIYEMRFDEVSAVYAQFGPFWVGIRLAATELGNVLSGHRPAR